MCCFFDTKTRIHPFHNAATERSYLETILSFGRTNQALKDTLENMKPKENSDQRKSRLRREAREANAAATSPTSKTDKKPKPKSTPAIQVATRNLKTIALIRKPLAKPTAKTIAKTAAKEKSTSTKPNPNPKPRRARKLVSAV